MQHSTTPLLARQAILDAQEKLIGYELLFRDEFGKACFSSNLQATSTVLNQWMLRPITTEHELCFINTDAEIVQLEIFDQLNPQTIVLEILENTILNLDQLDRYRFLKNRGFKIALDDFDFSPAHFNMLEHCKDLVDIVKVEIPALHQDFSPLIQLRKLWPKLLLAEKVEDQPTYAHCRRIGVDLFQGYYFARPEIISGQKYDSESEDVAFVLSQIHSESEIDQIEALFKPRGALVLGLLSYLNSAALSRGNTISSLRQALGLLGSHQIKQWLMLLLARGSSSNAVALVDHAIVHAIFNENLAKEIYPLWDRKDIDKAYLCALFSELPALLQTEALELFQRLKLSDDLIQAICELRGPHGELLNWTRSLLDPSQSWQMELPCSRSIINECMEKAWKQSLILRQALE